ncbi:MAG: hypothetical protein ACYDDB_04910 [bacterium]
MMSAKELLLNAIEYFPEPLLDEVLDFMNFLKTKSVQERLEATVISESSLKIETYYKKEWERTIRENGVPEEEIAQWKERLKLDRESTVEQQINWLKEAGFAGADCAYKFYKFAVIFGIK